MAGFFQGSKTTRCKVTCYAHGDEPGLRQTQRRITFEGDIGRVQDPGVIGLHVSKSLGASAGSFAISIKSTDRPEFEFGRALSDDDWVDISIIDSDVETHVMRGQIDSIELDESADTGATIRTWTIHGSDFGRIPAIETIWFDYWGRGEFSGGMAGRIWSATGAFLGGPPDDTVYKMLFGFLAEMEGKGRANWLIPKGVPRAGGRKFIDAVAYYAADFANIPIRQFGLDPTQYVPENQTAWSLATAWSDPMLCELFTDLMVEKTNAGVLRRPGFQPAAVPGVGAGASLDALRALTALPPGMEPPYLLGQLVTYAPDNTFEDARRSLLPEDTVMSVIFRDRPFPTAETPDGKIGSSLWFRLPTTVVKRRDVARRRLTRSGHERKNAYFVAPTLTQGLGAQMPDFQSPLWNEDSILRHGFRRMDVVTQYVCDMRLDNVLGVAEQYRAKVRDFYCLMHLMLSGEIAFRRCLPTARIGTRLRIENNEQSDQEDYYIETVDHRWNYRSGASTTLGVTHGWQGGDKSRVDALVAERLRYKIAKRIVP